MLMLTLYKTTEYLKMPCSIMKLTKENLLSSVIDKHFFIIILFNFI